MNNFEKWKNFYENNEMFVFNHNKNGLMWLKVRAIGRSKQIDKFSRLNNIKLISGRVAQKTEELFYLLEKMPDGEALLDDFLSDMNNEWYKSKGINEEELKEELYKVKEYSWGGDQNNSLDRHLVKHFVKDNRIL